MSTFFSHTLRILACEQCGGPVEAAVDGGEFTCTYCGGVNRLARRDESADRAEAALAQDAQLSESERFARLRAQDAQPEPIPESIASQLVDGRLPNSNKPWAEKEWLSARTQLASAASFPVSERLFHLTVLLTPHFEERRARATLETAIEVLPDARHRHVLRCLLAELAARAGDVPAAEAWLRVVHPKPVDLLMDTAYRLAAATLAITQGHFRGATEQLGMASGDVPLADRHELSADLLRIHATAELGDDAAAAQQMRTNVDALGRAVVRAAIERHRPLVLCERAYETATADEDAELLDEQRAEADERRRLANVALRRVQVPWFGRVQVVFSLIQFVVFSLLFSGVWTCVGTGMIEADPLFGAHADFVCSGVCEGCTGPYRHATWTTTTNGHSESFHDVYCSDPAGRIQAYGEADWWMVAVNTSPGHWLDAYEVAGGMWFIWLTMILAMSPVALVVTSSLGFKSRRGHVAKEAEARRAVEEAERERRAIG